MSALPMPWATKKEANMKQECIVGRYFVTSGTDGEINNQGAIIEMVSDAGYYIVVLFSWLTGGPAGEHIVCFDEIEKYFIFTGRASEEHDRFCERNLKINKPAYSVGKGAL